MSFGVDFECLLGTFPDARVVDFKSLLGTSPDDRVYFPRQSIHIPALVFQIVGGANFRPLLRHRRLRQNISVFDSKRCQRGIISR